MALDPINDNQDLEAPKKLDDREGVWRNGIFDSYNSFEEANAKLDGRVPNNFVAPFKVDGADVLHRWTGSEWVVDDAIQLAIDSLPTPSDETFIFL